MFTIYAYEHINVYFLVIRMCISCSCTWAYAYTYTRTYTFTYTYAHTYTCIYIRTYRHTYTYKCIYTNTTMICRWRTLISRVSSTRVSCILSSSRLIRVFIICCRCVHGVCVCDMCVICVCGRRRLDEAERARKGGGWGGE